MNYRLFRDSELKLWCLYIDSAPVQLPLYPADNDELPHKMLHLGLNRKLCSQQNSTAPCRAEQRAGVALGILEHT